MHHVALSILLSAALLCSGAGETAEPTPKISVERTVETVEITCWKAPMPAAHLAHLVYCCDEMEVPVELALALIERESRFTPDAVSATRDYGYMQINVCNFRTAYDYYGLDPELPMDNIEYGIILLSEAYERYGSWHKALMIYAGGPSVIGFQEWQQGYTEKTQALMARAAEIKEEGGV